MPIENVPPPIRESLFALGIAFLVATLGRLIWHIEEVRRKQRKFWSLLLIYELTIAIAMAVVGQGVADWLQLTGWTHTAAIGVLAYLGPKGTEAALRTYFSGRRPGAR
jgi:hypothetical protein